MASRVTEAPPPPAGRPARSPGKATTKSAGRAAKAARPRGGEARRIADLLPVVGDTAFRKFGFVQGAIVTRWPEIVGPKLARVTAPESLRFPKGSKADGLLSITVGGAHAPVVQHVLPDIIARVNAFFGYAAVARVRLTQGAVAPRPPVPQPPPQEARTIPVSPTLRAIADPELRAVLEGLASSLAKRDALPKVR